MTQILNDKIIHYGPGPNRTLQIESEISVKNANDSPLFKHRETNYSFKSGACSKEWGAGSCVPPYSDHLHFAGHRSKPWMTPPPFDLWNRTDQGWKASNHFWWRTVFGLQEENGINITYLKLV